MKLSALALLTLFSNLSFAKEVEQFDPEAAIIEVVHKYEIDIDLSLRLIFRGDVLFSPLGQLGGHAFSMKYQPGLFIYQTHQSGSARQSGLKQWDQIISVNGKKLSTIDSTQDEGPIVIFGHQLDEAEGGNMKLELEIIRDGETMPITIKLKKNRGSFETSHGLTGEKAKELQSRVLKLLKDNQSRAGVWKNGAGSQYLSCQAGLALLSTGDPKHLTEIRKCAKACIDIKDYTWTWGLAMNTIFLSEYFWATGDMQAYRKLEELSLELTKCVGPTGGTGHKYTSGTYDSDNFGASSVLCQLAWSACAQCLVAIDNESRNKSFDRILGSPSRLNSNNINYGGSAYKGGISNSAFRTSAFGLSLGLSRWEPQVGENIIQMLENNYKSFRYIHATPSQGTIFSALCLAHGSPKGYDEYLKYIKWRLTVAWEDNDLIHYVHPKIAPYNFEEPRGGGWDGDKVLGLNNLALIETIIILNAKKRNLLIQGNREMGWIMKKDAERAKSEIYTLHQRNYQSTLKQAEQSIRAGVTNQSDKYLSLLERHYAYEPTRVQLVKLRNDLTENRNWERTENKLRENEAEEYYEWAMNLRASIRGKFLLQLTKLYPDTQGAHKAAIALKTEERRSEKEAKEKKKKEEDAKEVQDDAVKDEEKKRRRMKKKKADDED